MVMKKRKPSKPVEPVEPTEPIQVWVGFQNNKPVMVQTEEGRCIATYRSKAAARRAHSDVRPAELVFEDEVDG